MGSSVIFLATEVVILVRVRVRGSKNNRLRLDARHETRLATEQTGEDLPK